MKIKVEFAQLAGRDNITSYNLRTALEAITACNSDTQLIVFPETHLMGFTSPETVARVAEPIDGPTIQVLMQAARSRSVSVVIGMAEIENNKFYNTTLLITPKGIALKYRKTHLWASDRGVFTAGDRFATCLWNNIRVGILICYDIEFPETARALAQLGLDLLIVTNGNMDPYGPTHRNSIIARAQENQVFALMVNRVKENDGGLVFAGGSALVDPFGTVLFESGRDEGQFSVELDFNQLVAARRNYSYLDDRRLKLPGKLIEKNDGTRELLIP